MHPSSCSIFGRASSSDFGFVGEGVEVDFAIIEKPREYKVNN